MKILFIASNSQTDFLSDSIFLGLKQLEGVEVYESQHLWYMYDSTSKDSLVNRVHGRGFTYYAEIPKQDSTPLPSGAYIRGLIKQKFFDKIIYANVHRNLDYINPVTFNYSKEDIIFLDGNDDKAIREDLLTRGTYFKREIDSEMYGQYGDLLNPIQFTIPKNKINTGPIIKEKMLGHVIPGVMDTFIFNNEHDYYEDYAKSFFAYTWKKSGWDCLRHYEILAAGTIPLFLDIVHIPQHTMKLYPVKILTEFYINSGIYDILYMQEKAEYDDRNTIILNKDLKAYTHINMDEDFKHRYLITVKELREYTLNYLTCDKEAERILKV